ncbi:hypothetical protein HanPI659440_Chr17g0671131 [Helianthus annuus]|nr:hypothetical protein HanPI659440_Chr17g0671131 [Helianthus annuus]
MGGNKLKVNIARFAVENGGLESGSEKTKPDKGTRTDPAPPFGKHVFAQNDHRSYRDVVAPSLGKVGSSIEDRRLAGGSREKVLEIPSSDKAFVSLHRSAVVGRTRDLDTLIYFDRLLRIDKVGYLNIQYLRGLSILVSFPNSDSAGEFLKNKDLWGPWFSKLELWEGQVLPFERIAWLKVQGIPLHLLDPDLLRLIGNEFCKLLYVPEDFSEDLDHSTTCVGVLVGNEDRINEFVCLKWSDKQFRIRVLEEEREWLSDSLGSPEVSSPARGSGDSGSLNVLLDKDLPLKENEQFDGPDPKGDVFNSVENASEGGTTPVVSSSGIRTALDNSHANIKFFEAVDNDENKKGSSGRPRRFKRRKGKTHPKQVGSPVDIRPLKRLTAQVEEEDIFGLEEILNKGPFEFQVPRPVCTGSGEQFAKVGEVGSGSQSLDLNRRASECSGQAVSKAVQSNSNQDRDVEVDSGFNLVDEVAETNKLGAQRC